MSVRDTKVKIYYECPDCEGTLWIKKGTSTTKCKSCKEGLASKLVSITTFHMMMIAAAKETKEAK
jgi:ribosomal protein L37AE/L43A